MRAPEECCADAATSVSTTPEFEQILDELGALVNRLRRVREASITISDALIGVQGTGESDDCAKPMPEHCFVARCSNLIVDFSDEVVCLEKINTNLLNSVRVEQNV